MPDDLPLGCAFAQRSLNFACRNRPIAYYKSEFPLTSVNAFDCNLCRKKAKVNIYYAGQKIETATHAKLQPRSSSSRSRDHAPVLQCAVVSIFLTRVGS